MDVYKVVGGGTLCGTVAIQGAKNAILPIIIASILTNEPVILHNISYLSDVNVLCELLESFGITVEKGENTLTITANNITSTHADFAITSKMRASFWVLGPLLARCHKAHVSLPGGCAIGARPVDLYEMALQAMGAKISIDNGYITALGPLTGATFTFPKISVGATINTVLAAVLTTGTTTLHNTAIEPEVIDLLNMLQKMGATIQGIGTRTLTITGVEKLHGCTYTILPDRIETATFLVAAAITKGKIFLKNAKIDLVQAVIDTLTPSNIIITQESDGILCDATDATLRHHDITTCEYPGFPTDAQSLLTALLSLSNGTSIVNERIFENRFMHIPDLIKMGANITQIDKNTVSITGVDALNGATVSATDLRAGAALTLAGIAANGETIVKDIHHIERGYYNFTQKLQNLGANVVKTSI